MLTSMTGFGSARHETADTTVTVEARSVNGRFLKTNYKLPPSLGGLEPQLEVLVKKALRRGTVTISVFVQSHASE
jgi:uncharacterized protein (TIGR00255 family)